MRERENKKERKKDKDMDQKYGLLYTRNKYLERKIYKRGPKNK